MQAIPDPTSLEAGMEAIWRAGVMAEGGLSIVLQGPLTPTHEAVRAAAQHWRALFPSAQIILAISRSDGSGGAEDPARPDEALAALCDLIVHGTPAAPLAPLKFGETAPNHGNLQIAAAQAGLRHARGAYTLRIRHDLSFPDTSFLDAYFRGARVRRGKLRAFGQRVMISQLFTLNPYGLERLPYHFSDFFHFGRTADVRSIWEDLAPYPAADGRYYLDHRHAAHSNAVERRFRTRVGVEQHVHFPVGRRADGAALLRFHNDDASIRESLALLLNDFIVCDMAATGARMDKWGSLFAEPLMQVLCVTARDWAILNEIYDAADRAAYLAAKAKLWHKRTGEGDARR